VFKNFWIEVARIDVCDSSCRCSYLWRILDKGKKKNVNDPLYCVGLDPGSELSIFQDYLDSCTGPVCSLIALVCMISTCPSQSERA
jgi:hypothetical protein